MTEQLQETLNEIARARGAVLNLQNGRLEASLGGRTISLQLPSDAKGVDALSDLPSALPSRAARGDIREKTLYNIVQDMIGLAEGSRLSDSTLQAQLPKILRADPASRRVLASVMARQYWFRPKGSSPTTFLSPFHADLPGAYEYNGRYKSFRGSLLLFLSFDGTGFDLSLAEDILEFMRSDVGLNPLDRELLHAARKVAEQSGQRRKPNASRLVELDNEQPRRDAQIQSRLRDGAFDQVAIDRIRRDLRTVMTLELPRHDKVAALVLALSLHIALHYYRVAFAIGEGLDAAARALDGHRTRQQPSFSGAVLFRVGSGGDRPVRHTDPCSTAWWRLDEQHLLALPANMISANLLHTVTTAVLGDDAPHRPDPHACAIALEREPNALALAELLCCAVAAKLTELSGDVPSSYDPGAGGYALRSAALETFRGRTSALKQRGRDVVNTMVGGFGGTLKRNRGKVRFFELDEQVLFLLVKLILDGAGVEQMPLQTEFLPALSQYGLAPQDSAEEELLADALQRLGLLDRYSDAGEATYVRHII
ncbi:MULTISPECIES: DNA phosphorothioation-dependent restriction protein DptG [Rhodococcus]|uniref:DNA phosphorothioation-dependent restriction protein DptG n=1 Tax=Rhodococcus TaxID=1827 RepID=UPI00029AB777|nr:MULTISPECIES: DNA phosphorothioation-dependent restriction protein DptG [Rhodococcus]